MIRMSPLAEVTAKPVAMVYEARGDKRKAADYFRKAYRFAMSNEGFDQNIVDWFLSEAKRLESQK